MKQIKQLGDQIGIKTFIDEKEKKAKKIWKNFKSELAGYDIIIIDTSGRDALRQILGLF